MPAANYHKLNLSCPKIKNPNAQRNTSLVDTFNRLKSLCKFVHTISWGDEGYAGNSGFSAILAEEYILIILSLSAVVGADRINLSIRI